MSEEKNKSIISYHTFMFPFTFENEDFSLKKIKKELESKNWKYKKFDIEGEQKNWEGESIRNYNEYAYFYPMVQELLYNIKENKYKENRLSKYFKYNKKTNEYCIYIGEYYKIKKNKELLILKNKKDSKIIKKSKIYKVNDQYYFLKKEDHIKNIVDKRFNEENRVKINDDLIEKLKNEDEIIEIREYNLQLVDIALRVFKTGVGILSFHIENKRYKKLEDVLNINQYGRRVYPQIKPIKNSKKIFLADKIIITVENKKRHEENFKSSSNNSISKTVMKILGDNFIIDNDEKSRNKTKIKPLIDDRMFTLCWYGQKDLANEVRMDSPNYNYLINKKWAKFLFVDTNFSSCQSTVMLKQLMEKHTYDRWIDLGTLYGISRYSFVCLTQEIEDLKKVNAEYILDHMTTMYYQIMVIALMQRASILKFKHKIADLVKKDDTEKIRELQHEYLEFINSMNFREITAQEQGIELYDMTRDIMGIDTAVKELEEEIGELHNYHSMRESEKVAKNSENLAVLAGVFLLPTLIISLSTVEKYGDIIKRYLMLEIIVSMILALVILKGWHIGFFKKIVSKKNRKRMKKLWDIIKKISLDRVLFLVVIVIIWLITIA